jgi:hypothetical protein
LTSPASSEIARELPALRNHHSLTRSLHTLHLFHSHWNLTAMIFGTACTVKIPPGSGAQTQGSSGIIIPTLGHTSLAHPKLLPVGSSEVAHAGVLVPPKSAGPIPSSASSSLCQPLAVSTRQSRSRQWHARGKDRESWLRCLLRARKGSLALADPAHFEDPTVFVQRESYLHRLLHCRKAAGDGVAPAMASSSSVTGPDVVSATYISSCSYAWLALFPF